VSGAVYSPAPPVFGHAAVPTPEPAPQWVTNDGTYPGYAVPGYGAPYGYGQPMAISKPTNGMAVAAMVVSIVGIAGVCAYGVGGLVGIVGAILGHVARRQIRERGEQGDGMALAGIIVGWIAAGLGLLIFGAIIVFFVWAVNTDPSTFNSSYNNGPYN
jgi:MFS family permease